MFAPTSTQLLKVKSLSSQGKFILPWEEKRDGAARKEKGTIIRGWARP